MQFQIGRHYRHSQDRNIGFVLVWNEEMKSEPGNFDYFVACLVTELIVFFLMLPGFVDPKNCFILNIDVQNKLTSCFPGQPSKNSGSDIGSFR